MSKSIALIGNPNCGKTTLFNRLTGAKQKIGNWPGVTVEQYIGKYSYSNNVVEVTDLPGCYSLIATKDMPLDERVTCEYILQAKNTIFVNVLDATNLARDLYLSLQLLERGQPVIVALNCMDLVASSGIKVDVVALAKQLGCMVVPISAKNGSGIEDLQEAINKQVISNQHVINYPPLLHETVNNWQLSCRMGEAIHILEGDELLVPNAQELVLDAKAALTKQLDQELDVYIAIHRHQRVQDILSVVQQLPKHNKSKLSVAIDKIVLHKIYGPGIFLSIMYLLFTCAINLGGVLQQWFETSSEYVFITYFGQWLTTVNTPTWLFNILTEGIGRGISTTLTFTPVLATMFFCLGILESTGYMTRAAFMVDRLMCSLGLSGRAFVPMIVGFGCNVPAVMGTRSLTNQRERILTIMMTPFMSCSARLAIYAIFVAAFFPLGGQNVIFSLYVIGILVAILTAVLLRSRIATNAESMAIMEMPDYRWPLLSGLLRQVWHRLKGFLLKAGILIVVLCVIINGVGYEALADIGKFLTPLFAPIGISAENWPATVGLLTGLIAKEAVVGTLNAFYDTPLHMVQSFGGVIPAYAYLLFTLLYFPCVSVVAAISKELNMKWALFSVVWSTGLAYLFAALFYQVATMQSWGWIIGLSILLVGFFFLARRLVGNTQKVPRRLLPTTINVQ